MSIDSGSESVPELPLFLQNEGFKLTERVAGGGFATVYTATWTGRPNEVIAAKVINLAKVDEEWVIKNLKNEMKILRKLRNHPNIVQVFEQYKTRSYAFIFMEFAPNGSVSDELSKTKKGLSEQKAKKYMRDVVNGMIYIHQNSVAHRDIKPDNFLIAQNEIIKLCDFGFACYSLSDIPLMKSTGCGTSEYIAIEIKTKREGEVYDAKVADIYSLGVSLYEMVFYFYPFSTQNSYECIKKQINRDYKIKSNTNPNLKDLIHRLLDPNPKTRMTAEEVYKHEWLTTCG